MKMMTMLVMTVMTVMMMTAGSAVARYGNAAHAAATRANRDIADDALKEIGPFSGFGSSFNHHPHTTRCTWILGRFHNLGLCVIRGNVIIASFVVIAIANKQCHCDCDQ